MTPKTAFTMLPMSKVMVTAAIMGQEFEGVMISKVVCIPIDASLRFGR